MSEYLQEIKWKMRLTLRQMRSYLVYIEILFSELRAFDSISHCSNHASNVSRA